MTAVARLTQVGLRYDDYDVLDDVNLTIERGDRWVVLGPNGSGKTSLVQILSLYLHPSRGTVEICGQRLGGTDVRALRKRIGLSSAAMKAMLRPSLTAAEVVMTATNGALEPWWHRYDETDRSAAIGALESMDVAHLGHREFGSLSSGEQQRVLLARVLLPEPDLVILDEPGAGLDMAAREDLVHLLDDLASRTDVPAIVLVTHHVEEIPSSFSKALLLGRACVTKAGPISEVVTAATLAAAFDLPGLRIERREGRWLSWTTSQGTQPA